MDNDRLVQCPFDVSHRILRSRLQYHLTICVKNHPNSHKKTCPYDSRHIIDEFKYQAHLEECPSRESVVRYKIQDTCESEMKILPIDNVPAGKATENWENDIEVKTYNPMENIDRRLVVIQRPGLSKSERKIFRYQERMRFNQLTQEESKKENEKRKPKSSKKKIKVTQQNKNSKPLSVIAENSNIQEDEDLKPLRRPHSICNLLNSSFTSSVSVNDQWTSVKSKKSTILKEKSSQKNTANDDKKEEREKSHSSSSSKSKEDKDGIAPSSNGFQESRIIKSVEKQADIWQVVKKKNSLNSSLKPVESITRSALSLKSKSSTTLKETSSANNATKKQTNEETKRSNGISSKSKEYNDVIARLLNSVEEIKISHEVFKKVESTKKEADTWQIVQKKNLRKKA